MFELFQYDLTAQSGNCYHTYIENSENVKSVVIAK